MNKEFVFVFVFPPDNVRGVLIKYGNTNDNEIPLCSRWLDAQSWLESERGQLYGRADFSSIFLLPTTFHYAFVVMGNGY